MSEGSPDGWKAATIGKLTKANSLFSDGDWVESKDQDPAGTNRLIQLADIGDGRFLNKSARFMNDEQFTRLGCTPLRPRDILVARMPDPLGRACLFPGVHQRSATVVDVAIIRTNAADHYWLMSAINSPDFRRQIEINASGTTRTRISRGALSSIKLLTPPKPEQQKIASILTSVDEVIEKTEAQISKLQDLKKGMMQELLTKGIGHTEFKDSPVGRIPKGWELSTVGQVATVKRGASPRPIRDPKWWGGTTGWVRISDVTISRKYLYKTTDYLSDEGVAKSVKIEKGEIILSICATIGRPIIVRTDACIHDGFVWFDNLQQDIDREFFYYFLAEKEDYLSSQRQTGTQGNLNTSIVSGLNILLPPKLEQRKIAAILTSVDAAIEKTEAQIGKLQNLKKALMQDLLTGKVRVKTDGQA
ncbi:restriction endonuclease subunit S [Candidatus Thiosymbion oneisti]|uniref:restriction endonuclease subunit S n=1 Tax=Candidatus Thiosymbion oneisti TaxID=589554 RepID=UPI000A44C51F|nr:restriction endonuclease subunit S [Candidatus Thiosymbion oneisti]